MAAAIPDPDLPGHTLALLSEGVAESGYKLLPKTQDQEPKKGQITDNR